MAVDLGITGEDTNMANFITATLHDNDFHRHLMAGVAYIAQHAEHELTADEFREWLVDFVVYHSAIRVINRHFKQTPEDLAHTRRYVYENLRVWYSDTKPEHHDENWEFVMHDRALNYTWAA